MFNFSVYFKHKDQVIGVLEKIMNKGGAEAKSEVEEYVMFFFF